MPSGTSPSLGTGGGKYVQRRGPLFLSLSLSFLFFLTLSCSLSRSPSLCISDSLSLCVCVSLSLALSLSLSRAHSVWQKPVRRQSGVDVAPMMEVLYAERNVAFT